MTKENKSRRRNLKTVKQVAESKAKSRKRRNSLNIKAKAGRLFSWLNQPVATHGSSDNKFVSGLTKDRVAAPKYVRESFAELKLVTWPTFRTVLRLTMAVILFAAFFTIIVAILDTILEDIFNRLFLQ